MMDVGLLVQSMLGLIVVLAILIYVFFFPFFTKKNKIEKKEKIKAKKKGISTEFKDLLKIIKDKRSTSKELLEALDLIIKYHGHIHDKLGLRPHSDFLNYQDIIFTICRHPNTNKDIIVKFDLELEKLNPSYKRDINDALSKGLDLRNF